MMMVWVHNSYYLNVCDRHVQSSFSSKYTLECDRKSKFKTCLEQYHNQFITTLRKDYLWSTYNEPPAAIQEDVCDAWVQLLVDKTTDAPGR